MRTPLPAGQAIDLTEAVGHDGAGVEHGALLCAFADAAHQQRSAEAGATLRSELGDAAFVEAAATVAIFNGLVRAADASGIPLDTGTAAISVDDRAALGIDRFAGASNTAAAVRRTRRDDITSVDELFQNPIS